MPYFGGKMTIGPTIAALLPAHRHYVETYCGSLAVLLAKAPSDHETVNDLDQRLITFWRVLRERPEDLARVCALTPHSRIEFDAAVTLAAADDIELARQVFVRLTQGRSGQLRRTGWRNYIRPASSSSSLPDYLAGYVDRWDRHTITAGTGQSGTWANRTEVLWSNRPLGAVPTLFDTDAETP